MRSRQKFLLPLLLLWSLVLAACTAPAQPAADLSQIDISQFRTETPWVELDGGEPAFSSEEMTTTAFEDYAPLDALGRCGTAYACLGPETMPTAERGEIGQVKPAGWHTVKYDWVDGKYLYNRCHLIAWSLCGENANRKNLLTGTRYLNETGMLPFEEQILGYIRETGNHVLYRVTPMYNEEELVCRGVRLEAQSVEDHGKTLCFHVYCYNLQPHVQIDYATGRNQASGD